MTDESELKITGDLFAEEIEEAKGQYFKRQN
jgi:hypothetical protein